MLRLPPWFFLAAVLSSCVSIHQPRSKEAAFDRAHRAWLQMEDGAHSAEVLSTYRNSVIEVVNELADHASPDEWPATMTLDDGATIRIDHGRATDHRVWQPRLFDHLRYSAKSHDTTIKGARKDGVGAPMSGIREHDDRDRDAEFVYRKGQHVPVTAVLEFGEKKEATLHLYDPREISSVKVGSQRLELAADIATPVQDVLDKRSFVSAALGGLFRPGRFIDSHGLFTQEPYREDKIPVIFVHGLMSDPHIWEDIVVAIESDPELAPRVQCWCFMYPSGLPVVSSSSQFRERLARAEALFDPDRNDKAFDRTMLVGHSMGGLVSRMQIVNSGNAFWNTWFTKPPEQVPLDGESSRALRSMLLFKANPHVKRVVFIATPHRGADMADGWLGQLGVRLIKLPQQLIQLATSVATLDLEYLNPARLEMRKLGATSIAGLSPQHPVILAINSLPMHAPCHSVIAVNKDKPSIEDTSDGVVPYRSSHLPQAKSEKLVKSWHSCTDKPDTVAEVVRVLHEHLKRKE